MGGSSPAPQTKQETTVQLTPEQRQILGYAMPNLQQFAAKTPQEVIPQYSQVAPFTSAQTAGQNLALATAPQVAGVVGGAADANRLTTSGQLLDPSSNPALRNIQGTITANTRTAVDKLLEQALPSIRSGAQLAGGFGGSRQGIAEGLAISRAGRDVGDIAAKTATDVALPGYLAGLEALTKGTAIAPSIASSLLLPAQTISGVGDVQQAMNQAQLSDQYARDVAMATYPLTVGQQYAGISGALPGAGSTTIATGPTPPKQNPLMQALGVGAALASFLPIPGAQVIGPLASQALLKAA